MSTMTMRGTLLIPGLKKNPPASLDEIQDFIRTEMIKLKASPLSKYSYHPTRSTGNAPATEGILLDQIVKDIKSAVNFENKYDVADPNPFLKELRQLTTNLYDLFFKYLHFKQSITSKPSVSKKDEMKKGEDAKEEESDEEIKDELSATNKDFEKTWDAKKFTDLAAQRERKVISSFDITEDDKREVTRIEEDTSVKTFAHKEEIGTVMTRTHTIHRTFNLLTNEKMVEITFTREDFPSKRTSSMTMNVSVTQTVVNSSAFNVKEKTFIDVDESCVKVIKEMISDPSRKTETTQVTKIKRTMDEDRKNELEKSAVRETEELIFIPGKLTTRKETKVQLY